MNNKNKGSASKIITAVVAIIVIIVAIYYYSNTDTNNSAKTRSYSNENISFNYPSLLTLTENGASVTLSHSIPYVHRSPCDFRDNAQPLSELTDFKLSIKLIDEGVREYIEGSTYPEWNYVSENPITLGNWSGYQVEVGVEGCGETITYLVTPSNKTIEIHDKYVTEFKPIITNYKDYLALPGIINPDLSKKYVSDIISSLKVL